MISWLNLGFISLTIEEITLQNCEQIYDAVKTLQMSLHFCRLTIDPWQTNNLCWTEHLAQFTHDVTTYVIWHLNCNLVRWHEVDSVNADQPMIRIWRIITDLSHYSTTEDELKGSGNNMVGHAFALLHGDRVWCQFKCKIHFFIYRKGLTSQFLPRKSGQFKRNTLTNSSIERQTFFNSDIHDRLSGFQSTWGKMRKVCQLSELTLSKYLTPKFSSAWDNTSNEINLLMNLSKHSETRWTIFENISTGV